MIFQQSGLGCLFISLCARLSFSAISGLDIHQLINLSSSSSEAHVQAIANKAVRFVIIVSGRENCVLCGFGTFL